MSPAERRAISAFLSKNNSPCSIQRVANGWLACDVVVSWATRGVGAMTHVAPDAIGLTQHHELTVYCPFLPPKNPQIISHSRQRRVKSNSIYSRKGPRVGY